MSRILKSPYINIDSGNKVSIEVINPEVLKCTQAQQSAIEAEHAENQYEHAKIIYDQMIAEAEMKARNLEENARIMGDMILQNAQKEGWEEGHSKGYEDGYKEGYDIGVAEANIIKKKAEKTHKDTVREQKETFAAMEPEMFKLVVGILKKLLTDSVQINPDVIIYLIKNGLYGSNVQGNISVYVSEEDYDTVIEKKNGLISFIGTSAQLEIVKDSSLKKCDCIIETPFGNIDCSLDQQYNALEKNLYYIFEHR